MYNDHVPHTYLITVHYHRSGEFCEHKICVDQRGDLQCSNPARNDVRAFSYLLFSNNNEIGIKILLVTTNDVKPKTHKWYF